MSMSDYHRYLPPDSLLEIDRLTRRAKHRQNGIIEKSRLSSREAAGFIVVRPIALFTACVAGTMFSEMQS
jgi:hypothetical protein